MARVIFQKLAKLARRHIGTKPCPEIQWDEVAGIEAFGTDAFGAFEVWLIIRHNDGTEVRLSTEHKGYDQILESLPARYPSIPANWLNEMAETPWDAERTLYSRDAGAAH